MPENSGKFGSLSDDPDSLTLSFSSQDDALNFAKQAVQDSKDFLTANNLNIAERYVKGELALVAKFRTRLGDGVYQLLFCAIPSWCADESSGPHRHRVDEHMHASAGETDARNYSVLISGSYPVKCPEKIVPSFVWLERSKERHNILGDILTSSLDYIFEVGSTAGEGEVSTFRVRASTGDGCHISGLVEGGSHIAERIDSNVGETFWEGFDELKLVHALESVVVELNDVGAWIGFTECIDFYRQVTEVFLCATDASLGAIKGISHGKT